MEETKLIKSFHPCRLISILVILLNIVVTSSIVAKDKDDTIKHKILADLPREKDFPAYYEALKKAIDFIVAHKYYVCINMKFGLFLVDTNLRQFLERKRPKMISGIRPRLEKLLDKLDEVAQYYSSMIEKHKDDPKIIPNIKLALLFHDTWPENPDTFHTAMLNRTRILPVDQLKSIYDTFENYKFRVYDFEENRPTSGESDECIALLVQSGISQFISRTQPTCAMNARCKRVILGENQFGYGLTHRLLLLAVARFKERCVVFSPKMDRYKSDTFCKLCYNEADYIATNSFGMPDLMFEQISICGLFGHAQFLRNHWLNTLRKFQTTAGCFSERLATGGFEANKLREDVNKEWMLDRPTDIIHGECNIHFTSVSMVTLSHALRYIIENYY